MTVANPGQSQSASTQAITALVLGILSAICCNLLGPFALYLGMQERKAIREGRSPAAGDAFALVAIILGIIGTILLVIGLFWLFALGGMAVLQGIMAASQQ
jgi:hypothetical protein